MRPVARYESEELMNAAMAVPKRLTSDDGREFELVEWFPNGADWSGHSGPIMIQAKLIPLVNERQWEAENGD